jgi:DNA-binding response OmpR family regulator
MYKIVQERSNTITSNLFFSCRLLNMEKKVLIVDDNRDILDLLQIILETEGYNVNCLENGNHLSTAIESYQPNLILMDIMLGHLDGRDLCKNLKSNPETKKIPIIMISASHRILPLQDMGCIAEAFIPKPFELDDLVASVGRLTA